MANACLRDRGVCYRGRDQGLQCRDRGQDQGVQSRGRGETEAFEISTEARPSRGTTGPRDGLETEASRPRPHPWKVDVNAYVADARNTAVQATVFDVN